MKFLKGALALVSAGMFFSCAGGAGEVAPAANPTTKPSANISLKDIGCPVPGSLRGEGFGETSDIALPLAQKQIASRIQSTVVSSAELKSLHTDENGSESLKSSYAVNSQVFSRLENAQDARAVGEKGYDGGVGVVACMTIDDAMKPFVQKYKALSDSLLLVSASFDGTEHPLKKMDSYKLAQKVHTRMVEAGNVLESFNYPHDVSAENAFNALNENFREFKSRYAFYYDASSGGEAEMSVFSRISKEYKVVAGECQGGVLLSVNVTPSECKDGSFGTTCSSMLTLTGTSCGGDAYFSQRTLIKGTGKYGKDEAEERLLENITSGDWFTLWTKVLDQWDVK